MGTISSIITEVAPTVPGVVLKYISFSEAQKLSANIVAVLRKITPWFSSINPMSRYSRTGVKQK